MNTININFFLNKKFKNINIPANITVLEYIREYSGLTGTKLGCGEGDCGSCTISVGTFLNGEVKYKAVNSCLMPVAKMHNKHIVTIEGLAQDENELHPVQKSIIENHATQCGFCTPGISMSLFCYLINHQKNPKIEDAVKALEGNLCRCTGYKSIKKSALQDIEQIKTKKFVVPEYFDEIKNKLSKIIIDKKIINSSSYYLPQNKTQLFNFLKKNNDTKIINGGTDIMVSKKVKGIEFDSFVDISEIKEFNHINFENNKIIIGANVCLNEIIDNSLIKQYFPVLSKTLLQMASVQIRNVATITGNICNASPVADAAVVLMAANAKLIIASKNNKSRKINIKDFYLGYKKIDIKNTEVVEAIEIPIDKSLLFSFEKTSKRKAVDISTVNSAISIKVKDNIIKKINIAFGGIAATPILLKDVENFLTEKNITEKVILDAAVLAMKSVNPISDMRGSEQYRMLLVKNHIIKHFHKLFSSYEK